MLQADAADETAIEALCKQAIKEEGRLDVFFANVSDNHRYALSNSFADVLGYF